MNPWIFLFAWVGSQTLQLIFAALAVFRRTEPDGRRRLGSLIASTLATILPLITLLLFVVVFVIGRSSNVAQLAGESGYKLWSLWCGVWPLLFLGNPVALLGTLVAALLPPYPPRYWQSFTSRIFAIAAAGFAWYTVITFFPDA